MTAGVSIGDEAPNFDLSSTEGALLMLRDEVQRTTVLLYFFRDAESERTQADLAVLARHDTELRAAMVRVLGVSTTKMPRLNALQAELALPFPLLRDDRDFLDAYGVEAAKEEGEAQPALFLVARNQSILWMQRPLKSIDAAISEVIARAKSEAPPTSSYPRSVINRLVDRFASSN